MPAWQAGSGGGESRSRQIKEDPRIAHSFNNGKRGRRIASAPRILQVKKRNADNASVDLPKIFLIQLG
jgi:hypothetical protein